MQAQDLARPGQGRAQPRRRQRHGRAVPGQALERGPQRLEALDQPLHRELGRGAGRHDGRRVHHAPLGQHAGAHAAGAGGLEQDQLHGAPIA
jgi:hypothetical protein